MRVEYSDIEEGSLILASPECSLAPSAVLEVNRVRALPVSGCRSDSILTSWHTSVSRLAVTAQMSL